MQALDRRCYPGFQHVSECQWLHTQHSCALLHKPRKDLMREAPEMVVQNVQRHLASVKVKVMLGGYVQHSNVNCRVFMPGEAYVTNLAGFLGGHDGLVGTARREIAIRVLHPDVFVELNQVDH